MRGSNKRMDKTTKIVIISMIIGAILFLGFFIISYRGYEVIGIPYLGNFIAMIGIIIFFISGFLFFSLRVPKY
jgi:hypothetical protein